MAHKSNTFWVLAKRLENSKWKKVRASDLFNVTPDWHYWSFLPEDCKDFQPRTYYGRIEMLGREEYMYYYYILHVSGEYRVSLNAVEGYVLPLNGSSNRVYDVCRNRHHIST